MTIKKVILAFTLVALVSTGPVTAAVESNDKVERAESAFQTFKKDIKCFFSREGCSREQKIRMAKRGLKLLGAVALLYGFLKFGAKAKEFRAKVMAQDAKLEADLAGIKRRQREAEREARAADERERRREPEREKERKALKEEIERKQQERAQQEQQHAQEKAESLLQQRTQLEQELLDKKPPLEAQRSADQEAVSTLRSLHQSIRAEWSALSEKFSKLVDQYPPLTTPINHLKKFRSKIEQTKIEFEQVETELEQVKAKLEEAEAELERIKKAESALEKTIKGKISEIDSQILRLGYEVRKP